MSFIYFDREKGISNYEKNNNIIPIGVNEKEEGGGERDLHTSKIKKNGYGSLPWQKKKKKISVVLIKFFFI